MDVDEFELRTGATLVTDITGRLAEFCRDRGDGLLNVFLPHATAGLAVMETGSGSEPDLSALVDRILPAGAGYRHSHGSPGHGRDHVLPAVISPSLTVPVRDGRPWLGTWQSVVVVDSNGDNAVRHVRLSFLPG